MESSESTLTDVLNMAHFEQTSIRSKVCYYRSPKTFTDKLDKILFFVLTLEDVHQYEVVQTEDKKIMCLYFSES